MELLPSDERQVQADIANVGHSALLQMREALKLCCHRHPVVVEYPAGTIRAPSAVNYFNAEPKALLGALCVCMG